MNGKVLLTCFISGLSVASSVLMAAPNQRWMIMDEVRVGKEHSLHRAMFTEVGFLRQEHSPDLIRYEFSLDGFASLAAGRESMGFNVLNDDTTYAVLRNPLTEQVSCVDWNSPLAEIGNQIIARLGEKLPIGSTWKESWNPIGALESIVPFGNKPEFNYRTNLNKTESGRTFLILEYDSTPCRYQSRDTGAEISQTFSGRFVADPEMKNTWFFQVSYTGEANWDGRKVPFSGSRTLWAVDRETGSMPDGLSQLVDKQGWNVFVRPVDFDKDLSAMPAFDAPWLDEAIAISDCVALTGGLKCEQRTNPIWMAVFVAAHVLDSAYTMASDMVHAVKDVVESNDYSHGNIWNSVKDNFGKTESPLEKYVYRNIARVGLGTASKLGLVDPDKVEAYAEIGGMALHLAGSLAAGRLEKHAAHRIWGSASYAQGLNKTARIWLGKFIWPYKGATVTHIRHLADLYGYAATARNIAGLGLDDQPSLPFIPGSKSNDNSSSSNDENSGGAKTPEPAKLQPFR